MGVVEPLDDRFARTAVAGRQSRRGKKSSMSMRNPSVVELELLEHMPVRPEYRDALSRVLEFVRACGGHEPSSTAQAAPRAPLDQIEALNTRHERDLREAVETMKKKMRIDIQFMSERHKTEERRLRAQIADLSELAFPPGTWVLAKGDARHARLKSLYCAWLARWTRYLHYIRASTMEGIGTVRTWPNYAEQDRIAHTVRALYDAAV